MRTLSQLIQEAIPKIKAGVLSSKAGEWDRIITEEITNIVKESFKNTRVEEREIPDTKIEELTETGKINRAYKVGFNDALSDKHNKENQFLNN